MAFVTPAQLAKTELLLARVQLRPLTRTLNLEKNPKVTSVYLFLAVPFRSIVTGPNLVKRRVWNAAVVAVGVAGSQSARIVGLRSK